MRKAEVQAAAIKAYCPTHLNERKHKEITAKTFKNLESIIQKAQGSRKEL